MQPSTAKQRKIFEFAPERLLGQASFSNSNFKVKTIERFIKERLILYCMTEKITPDNARQYLRELFAKAGKSDGKYRTEEEQLDYLSGDGAQRFKIKALGFFGSKSIKNLEEFAKLLTETGIVLNMEEGRQTVPKIVEANKLHNCTISRRSLFSYLNFDEVKNSSGDVKYKITAGTTFDY